MNKTVIITIVLVVAAIVGLMAWGYNSGSAGPTQVQTGGATSLTAMEKLFNFGTISMKNGKVSHAFQVTNPTDKDITLRDLSTSCMCTTAFIVDGNSRIGPFGMAGMGGMTSTDYVIKAGATANIEAIFDPNAHGPAGVGTIDRIITLTEANGSALKLEIKAVVTP